MQSTHTLRHREIPLDDSWDVIVAGGGPAGCTAAAAAAREGARTLLVEATGALGGMGTGGLVPAWCPFSDGEQIIYRGLAEKVFAECRAGMKHVGADALDWVPIDPERLKRVYDALVADAGATVRFNTMLAAVEAEGGEVSAAVLCNKAGLTAASAKVYVDCTGDGDLAVWAGGDFEKGDADGAMQPVTHCFILSNVDEAAFLSRPKSRPSDPACPTRKMADDPNYPLVKDAHFCHNLVGPATMGFNTGHLWDVDNTDPAGLSRALMDGRKLADQLRAGLAEYDPAVFGDAFLAATGALMGVRETRRIVGDYVLTLDDYLSRRSFPDEICRNSYYLDVHFTPAEAAAYARGEMDLAARSVHYGPGESHGIPYRCLTPKGLANVLVAGRSISTDRRVQGSTRVMPVCLAMGEAAGLAAALASAGDADVHAVDTDALRARLRAHGAYLP